jgi:hypothetical protein
MFEKITRLSLLFCFLSLSAVAQKNLKEALVVFNNTDTIRGFIEYREWFANPAAVLFTKDKNTAVARYTTAELSYFEVAGQESYQRHTVSVSLSNDAMSNTSGEDTTTETRTVFLKIVAQGSPLSLFSYRDDLKQRLYVLETNHTTPVELLNSIYMFNGQVKEGKQYRADLAAWAATYRAGDQVILSKIGGMGYYTNDIASICRQIDGSQQQAVKRRPNTSQKGSAFRIFAGGGIQQGALTIVGDSRFAGKNTHPFNAPLVDIGADIPFNRTVGKLVFRVQLHITGYKTAAYIFQDYSQYTEEYFLTFRQQNIQIAPQLLYNIYNQKKLKWFAAAGPALNISSYPTNKMYFIRKSTTNAEATDNSYIKFLRNAWVNFCFSTGVSVNRLELAMLYCPPASITQSSGSGVDNSSLQLRLNFYIKK